MSFTVRKAREGDLDAVGRLGANLLRQHHRYDPARFIAPGADPEAGYAWFLSTQLAEPDVLLLVGELDGAVAAYLYAAIEPRSWKELRDEAGFIHDVVVDERFRGQGMGRALMQAAADWFASRGMPRIVLWSAHRNEAAQRLFARLGFRPTMLEMTCELPPVPPERA